MRFKIFYTVLLGLSLIISFELNAQQPKLSMCKVTIVDEYNKETTLMVEVAKTVKEKTYGLMDRESLGENEGMLFVYPKEEYMNFWMKNTKIALSIAYINSYGEILEIKDMKPLDATKTYPSKQPCKYAIEVNKGWFKNNNIKPGSKVVFNGCFGK